MPPTLPGWVRALDVAIVFLAVLCWHSVFYGGARFRFWYFGFSAESAWRNVVWLGAAVGLRQYFHPEMPLPLRVLAWAKRQFSNTEFLSVFATAVGSRVGVLAVGAFAVAAFGVPYGPDVPRIAVGEIGNLPSRWDAAWYANVATYGYQWNPGSPGEQNVAFFPAWPVLMKVGVELSRMDVLHVGTIIALACFVAAIWYLFKLARVWIGADRALVAACLLASYPFSVYFSAPYTESLFLLAAIAATYHFQRGGYVVAGVWGMVAGLARPNGFLVAVPLAVTLALAWWRDRSRMTSAGWVGGAASAVMPAVGTALFCFYLYDRFGDPFAWLHAHAAWGRSLGSLVNLFNSRLDTLLNAGLGGYIFGNPYELLNTAAAVFAILLAIPVALRLGLGYGLFILANVMPPLMMGGTTSIARLTSTLFPLFIAMAAWLPKWAVFPLLLLFAMGQAFVATLFFTWKPMF